MTSSTHIPKAESTHSEPTTVGVVQAETEDKVSKVVQSALMVILLLAAIVCAFLRIPWNDSVGGIILSVVLAPITFLQLYSLWNLLPSVEYDEREVRYRRLGKKWTVLLWSEIDEVHESYRHRGIRLASSSRNVAFVVPWRFDGFAKFYSQLVSRRGTEGLLVGAILKQKAEVKLPFEHRNKINWLMLALSALPIYDALVRQQGHPQYQTFLVCIGLVWAACAAFSIQDFTVNNDGLKMRTLRRILNPVIRWPDVKSIRYRQAEKMGKRTFQLIVATERRPRVPASLAIGVYSEANQELAAAILKSYEQYLRDNSLDVGQHIQLLPEDLIPDGPMRPERLLRYY